ncbi:hypothetical protein DL96DRAFT_1491470, partial [Flagelloscypha sp. PMI_526]
AAAIRVSWDSACGRASTSLDVVAYTNGDNGVETKYGWKKLGDVSTFPLIGGADVIAGWNDVDCVLAGSWLITTGRLPRHPVPAPKSS